MGLAYRDRHSLALFVLLSIGLTQWPSTSFAGCEHVMEIAFSPPWLSDYWREETPRQINISSGIPRGGYGDIAPNLLMARRLREALPSVVKIQVVVERFAEDHVRNLIAEYQGQALKIDGIDYLPEAQARPDLLRSDFALVFSSANGPGNGNSGRLDADAGPKAGTPFDPSVLPDAQRLPFIYSRFGLSFTEPVTAIRSPVRFSDERSERPAKENFLRFSAGAGNFGFYVRPSS